MVEAALIGDEDPLSPAAATSSCRNICTTSTGWNALPTEMQERIIGRAKLSDIELDDEVKPTYAHNALTTSSRTGKSRRSCAPTCRSATSAQGEFGTYFIGYAARRASPNR